MVLDSVTLARDESVISGEGFCSQAVGEGFFLIRFSAKEDHGKVLKEGPWFVNGHYLSIRSWEANFNPVTANVTTIAAWVRLPNLPIEYYEPSVLKDIGRAIGPVMRIDTHTATESRGRFARLCVQISYDRPLIKLIKVGGISQPVQYEGLNLLCFSCGRAGHKEENCPYRVRASEMADGDDTNGENLEGNKPTSSDNNYQTKDKFGPWVLVARKKKVNKVFGKDNFQLSSSGHRSPLVAGPSQALSPLRPRFVYSESEKSVRNLDHVMRSAPHDPIADHTNPANGEDSFRVTSSHMASKSHGREQKNKQKLRNPVGTKGNPMNTHVKDAGFRSFGQANSNSSKMPIKEWKPSDQTALGFKAFTAGGTLQDGIKGVTEGEPHESPELVPSNVTVPPKELELPVCPSFAPVQALSKHGHEQNGDLAGAQSDVAENIARANLKKIDPALRSKPEARQSNLGNADLAFAGSGYDNDEMQYDEGNGSHLS